MYIFWLNGLVHSGPVSLYLSRSRKLLANPLARIIQMRNFRKREHSPFANECYILFWKNISLRCCRRVINKFAVSPRPTPRAQAAALLLCWRYINVYIIKFISLPLTLSIRPSLSLAFENYKQPHVVATLFCFGFACCFRSDYLLLLPLPSSVPLPHPTPSTAPVYNSAH